MPPLLTPTLEGIKFDQAELACDKQEGQARSHQLDHFKEADAGGAE